MVASSYEGFDNEEQYKTVPIIHNDNNGNVVSDSNNNDNIENESNNFSDEDIDDKVEVTPHYQHKSGSCNEKVASFV